MHLAYSAVLTLVAAVSSPWWLTRMLREGRCRASIRERLGAVPARILRPAAQGSIWIHAVSVGEVMAVSGLVSLLKTQCPERRLFISTTTATGQKLARSRFGEENVFYFPVDFRFAVRSWLKALRPSMVVLTETEFWPNFLDLAHKTGTRVAVVNARISDRSLPRYRLARWVMRPILRVVDLFLAQSEEDKRRLISIGASPERVGLTGNLKFDSEPPQGQEITERLRRHLLHAHTPVVVFGSTVEGEEGLLLPAMRAVFDKFPRALIILAPRHPQRFGAVAELLAASGLRVQQRSAWDGQQELAGSVLLLDSIGELASVYALATVAFVGGSLVDHGGHNIIEPAQAGVAIMVGPHTRNFRDVIAMFRRAEAVREVNLAGLPTALLELLENEQMRSQLGRRARNAVEAQSGAAQRTLAALEELLKRQSSPSKGLQEVKVR